MYGGQSSVIPIRIAGSGVMPLIFAFALISFPGMIISLTGSESANNGLTEWFSGQSPHWYVQLYYMVALCLLIFAFSFFYQSMQFNPEDVSKTIQQNGGFIQGIRPGNPRRLFKKDFQQNNVVRRDLSLAGRIYSVHTFHDTVEHRNFQPFASVGILDYGYSHRGFGCVGA